MIMILKRFKLKNRKKYDRIEAQLRFELAEGRKSGEEGGWISSKDVRNHFKARMNTR